MIWVGWRRMVALAFGGPLVVAVAMWVLRVPPPPVETLLPLAPPVATTTADAPVLTSSDISAGWLDPLGTLPVSELAVHVVGAVRVPGVYRLAPGSRADDALQAAGGPTNNADLQRVNLALPVHDGEQLYVPRVGERVSTTTISSRPADSPGGSRRSEPSTNPGTTATTLPLIVDLNRATAADLDRLPGVGPSTAKAIIDHRTRNGPFASVDDLLAVRGIGPAKLAEIRPWVRV